MNKIEKETRNDVSVFGEVKQGSNKDEKPEKNAKEGGNDNE